MLYNTTYYTTYHTIFYHTSPELGVLLVVSSQGSEVARLPAPGATVGAGSRSENLRPSHCRVPEGALEELGIEILVFWEHRRLPILLPAFPIYS